MKLFEEIRLIELELHSYCNRKCGWCPNLTIDRTETNWLDEDVLMKLIYELKDLKYKRTISFSRYNEPFAHISKFKRRASLIKRILPDVKLVTNTNGDFLFGKILDDISMDELTIMDYDDRGIEYCKSKIESLGATIEKIQYPYIFAHYGKMDILYFVDWKTNGLIVDRGGSIESCEMAFKDKRHERHRPCHEPLKFLGIDFNGNVMPCCNLRSDNLNHMEYVLGNIYNSTLIDVVDSDRRREFIGSTMKRQVSKDKLPTPCRKCQKDPGRYTRKKAGIKYE